MRTRPVPPLVRSIERDWTTSLRRIGHQRAEWHRKVMVINEFLCIARILKHGAMGNIDMPKRHGGDGIVACAAQNGEGNQRPVAFVDVGFGGHGGKHMADLLKRWRGAFTHRLANARVIVRWVEIAGVKIR
jgi:hypothetical protein